MDWLKTLAPTVASALGGPLAGLAVSAVSKALGIDEDKVQDTISEGKLNAEQIAQLKLAEIELQKQAQELGLNFEKLAVEDRKSARDMQIATRSFIPATLAIIVTIGFFGILLSIMFSTVIKSDAMMVLLGSLGTAWTAIVSYYFGSSAGSAAKTELLHQSTPIGNDNG
jgi:hypothetical protein